MNLKRSFSKILLIFLIACGTQETFGQYVLNQKPEDELLLKTCLNHIYNFEFEAAQSKALTIKSRFPNHPIYSMLMAMIMYWEMTINSKEQKYLLEYRKHLEQVLHYANTMKKAGKYVEEATFFQMCANSSLTYLMVRDRNYSKALFSAREAYVAMNKGLNWMERYPDFYFSSGIFNYYSVQYPETHPLVKPLLFMMEQGSKKKGIELLKMGSEKAIFTHVECMYFVAHIHLKYEGSAKEAVKYSSALVERYPANFFYRTRHIEALIYSQQYETAEAHLAILLQTNMPYFRLAYYIYKGILAEKSEKDAVEAISYWAKAEEILKGVEKKKARDMLNQYYYEQYKMYKRLKNESKAQIALKNLEEIMEYAWIQKELSGK